MKRTIILAVILTALSAGSTAYACSVYNRYAARPGDTVVTPTAKCDVAAHSFDCKLRRSRKHHRVTATIYPKAIFIAVNGNVRFVCFSNGQCLKS